MARINKHIPGDGYQRVLKDYTNECAILANAALLAASLGLGTLWELWSTVYPSDPMTPEDAAPILNAGVLTGQGASWRIKDEIAAVLSDLEAIGCDELAAYIEVLLREKGVAI